MPLSMEQYKENLKTKTENPLRLKVSDEPTTASNVIKDKDEVDESSKEKDKDLSNVSSSLAANKSKNNRSGK